MKTPALRRCGACGRHLRELDGCPFCASTSSRWSLSAAAMAAILGVACPAPNVDQGRDAPARSAEPTPLPVPPYGVAPPPSPTPPRDPPDPPDPPPVPAYGIAPPPDPPPPSAPLNR